LGYAEGMHARGTFSVELEASPPFEEDAGIAFSRVRVDKRFEGTLEAESVVHMLAVMTPVKTSRAYVAVERVVGTLDGREGAFAVTHLGVQTADEQSLALAIVPDSGTGELEGITGTLSIEFTDGQHFYEIDWSLP